MGWDKGGKTGKLSSFTLVDETSAIRCTMFNEAIDKFNSILAPGSVCYISGGSIKQANKRFNTVQNDYELTLDENSKIELCTEVDTHLIPHQRYNFISITILPKREPDSLCDVLGVVMTTGDITKIIQKSNGNELAKRTFRLADQTAAVDVTIWGDNAYNFNYPVGTVLALRAARIGTFDGCSLSLSSQSAIDANPKVNGCHEISVWYRNTGGNDVKSISGRQGGAGGGDDFNFRGRKYLDQVPMEGIGKSERGDSFELRCTPFYINSNQLHYTACPTCNKKVTIQPGSSSADCEKCKKPVPNPVNRYMCSMNVSDGVATAWVTLFNEAGEQFFGMKADALLQQQPEHIVQIIASLLFKPTVMRVRAKEESMGADAGDRMKYTCSKIVPIQSSADQFPNGTFAKEVDELDKELNLYY
eukprot:GDKK01035106.1.p1 GENE.GDKK01035106.1~~GDKK01035106.1.p1  ORF type:complete len:417 (-),score=75.58 GDKK01035106.1:126-1376(-)